MDTVFAYYISNRETCSLNSLLEMKENTAVHDYIRQSYT